ncbi:MAG: hypothetical protein JHC95_04230 [Solirubrobacteraceae bacterium]|nr:hypothetical protein [Solirubrobacteraceae bacterium]
MTQVSRPMLIALVGVVAFAAVWFMVLRPKPAEVSTADAPAGAIETPVTDRPQQAQEAIDAANATITGKKQTADAAAEGTSTPSTSSPATASSGSEAATSGSTGSSSSAATTGSAAKPTTTSSTKVTKTEPGTPAGEAAILRALDSGKVAVVLFWTPSGSDDRAAYRAVREATHGTKNVKVQVVRASEVGTFESITGDVTVTQSPTTMVISPDHKAVTLTGLIDPLEIEQAVVRMRPKQG